MEIETNINRCQRQQKEGVMETKKDYNGWTNYETWNVKLWMDNDQESYDYWQERTKEALEGAEADQYFTKEQNATNTLREQLKDEMENIAEDMLEKAEATASFVADLLHSALSEVNWQEIAVSLVEDYNN